MRAFGWAGLILFAVAEYGLIRRIEPFCSWFYCFAWWSYILLADNLLLKLSGRSLFTTRRRELARMLPLSVFIWLIFEVYNLAIRNWAYSGVPAATWIRWAGYALAFATVLPGIFVTADLIHCIGGLRRSPAASESESLSQAPSSFVSRTFPFLGLALCIAPFLWPRFFFPAVWIGPIFVCDPLLERLGVRSLSLSIAAGDRSRVWSLLAGGLVCGGLWEFWNYWAGSKWIYTVPFFQHWKVFEMPLLGFLGFPPFALECWILYHLLSSVPIRWSSTPVRAGFWVAIAAFCVVVFRNIDAHTVIDFVGAPTGSSH
jgi:hypothetical protein